MAGKAKDHPSFPHTCVTSTFFFWTASVWQQEWRSLLSADVDGGDAFFPPSIWNSFPAQIIPRSFICLMSQSLDSDYQWDFFSPSFFHATSNTPFKEGKHSLLENGAFKIVIFFRMLAFRAKMFLCLIFSYFLPISLKSLAVYFFSIVTPLKIRTGNVLAVVFSFYQLLNPIKGHLTESFGRTFRMMEELTTI